MNLDELCDEVNKILKDQKIMVADARTSSIVTPRNVRYYQTIGLLHLPVRRDGRAEYDNEHLDRLVEIKKAQHDGISLDQMHPKREPLDIEPILKSLRSEIVTSPLDFSIVRNVVIDRAVSVKKDFVSVNSEPVVGWSIHFGDIALSGRGARPTQEQVDAIREILHDEVEVDNN